MALGKEVGLSPGDFVLDGDPAPSPIFGPFLLRPNGWMHQDATWYGVIGLIPDDPAPSQKGAELPIFGSCLLRPNGCMDHGATWYRGRPHPKRLYVRCGPSSPPLKGAGPPSAFSAHFYCGQMARCIKLPLGMEVGLSPGDFVLHGGPVPSPEKGADSPNFRPTSIVAKRVHASRCRLVRR